MTRKEERELQSIQYGTETPSERDNELYDLTELEWAYEAGAEWADSTAWKPADGDNLPEIDKEVIAIIIEYGYYKAVFAHRPNPNGDAICFDEGGWNQPNVKWWLDLELPKMEE